MDRSEEPWDIDAIRELYRASSPLMRQLQDFLAARPGQEVRPSEVADSLGISRSALAGAVGAFSGLVYRRFGRYEWPFEVRRAGGAAQTVYVMPWSVASCLRDAGDAGDPRPSG